jgi:succinyl-CoA synthetase alpha subunit
MAIIATEKSVVLIQGITGSEGSFRTKRMLEYGTKIVAGVTPGKGGQFVHGVPVYDSVEDAKNIHPSINTVVQFVPAKLARDASLEAIDAGIPYLVIIAEGIPFQDMMEIIAAAREEGVTIVGPNTAGVISPGICELGATAHCVFHGPGKIGVITCTGSIQWYLSRLISLRGWGQSTFVDVGGDPIRGLDYDEALLIFEEDSQTEAILLVGEIGGDSEIRAAELIKSGRVKKPVVAYIYGRTAPHGRRLGHAGAVIERGKGDARSKIEALKDAGATVITYPQEVVGAFEQLGIKPIPELLKKPIREARSGA